MRVCVGKAGFLNQLLATLAVQFIKRYVSMMIFTEIINREVLCSSGIHNIEEGLVLCVFLFYLPVFHLIK